MQNQAVSWKEGKTMQEMKGVIFVRWSTTARMVMNRGLVQFYFKIQGGDCPWAERSLKVLQESEDFMGDTLEQTHTLQEAIQACTVAACKAIRRDKRLGVEF